MEDSKPTKTTRPAMTSPVIRRGRLDAATLYRPATLFYLASMTLMLVPMLTLVDMVVARYFEFTELPREVAQTIELSLILSHGTGVTFILVALMMLAPRLRWHVPRLATLAFGGGAVATIVKMFVLRPRPSLLQLEQAGHEHAWLWVFDWNWSQIAIFDPSTRAFPSGHVVTATALAIGLGVLLPRGRALFVALWVGVMMQRMVTGQHFLSDVCGGVGFGLLWSYVCFHPRLLGMLFDKMIPEGRKRDVPRRSFAHAPTPATTPATGSDTVPLPIGETPERVTWDESEKAA
ncbi:MAG: phosphatase PAP2 family protein [Planctomycetota bacterium]